MTVRGGRLEAKITLTASHTVTFTDSVGAQVVTWVAGSYYISDLIAQANTDLIRTWVLSISDGEGTPTTSTGRCTIDSGGSYNFTVTFTSTQIRDILGFTGNIGASASAQTGSRHCRGIWIPGVQHKWSPYGDNAEGSVVSGYRPMKSATGVVTALSGSRHRVHRDIRWEGVPGQRAMAHQELFLNESWENFYNDCTASRVAYIPPNPSIRLYWNADDDASYTYAEGRLLWPADFSLEQFVPGWNGRYRVALPPLVCVDFL